MQNTATPTIRFQEDGLRYLFQDAKTAVISSSAIKDLRHGRYSSEPLDSKNAATIIRGT